MNQLGETRRSFLRRMLGVAAVAAAPPLLRALDYSERVRENVERAFGLDNWDPRSRWGTGLGSEADHRRIWLGLKHHATRTQDPQTSAGFEAAKELLR